MKRLRYDSVAPPRASELARRATIQETESLEMARMFVAMRVLDDCIRAHNVLDVEEHDHNEWRVRWIGALALIRMVGHVLRNIDGKDPKIKQAADLLFLEWNDPSSEHRIFREFICAQRNLALKEYEIGVLEADEFPLAIFKQDDLAGTYHLPADLFRPMVSGSWEGEDARDVYLEAINWWFAQLERLAQITQ